MDIKELYQEIVLDHGKNPRTKKNAKVLIKMLKVIILYVETKYMSSLNLDNEKVKDISFEGEGWCNINGFCSIMTETIKGQRI